MWGSTGGGGLALENVLDVKSTAMVLLFIYSCKCWLHSISSILQILKNPGGEPEWEDVIKYSLLKAILTKWASKGTWQHVQIVLGKSSRWQAPRKMLEGEEVISPSALTQQEVPSVMQEGQALCLHTFSLNTVRGFTDFKTFSSSSLILRYGCSQEQGNLQSTNETTNYDGLWRDGELTHNWLIHTFFFVCFF